MSTKIDSKQNICNNYGFSLVEAIVAVAIIAIVFTPLLRNFTTASLVNSRAQKLQNVTSLAESIMEDVKSKSIQQLHDEAVSDDSMSFLPEDEGGGLTVGKLTKPSATNPYVITYSDVTATQGRTYDARVTIDTSKYSNADHDGLTDISDANIRELPTINKVDSHQHAVLSWEINQYDAKAIENLVTENATTSMNESELHSACLTCATTAVKDINIEISEDSSMTKITCYIEYKTGNSSDKSLKYLVYSGYFDDQASEPLGGPNVYLFYTLSEKIAASGEAFKTENINIEDKTSGKRHSIYFIMQDNEDKLSTSSGCKVYLSASGGGWSRSVSLNPTSIIDDATITLSEGADASTEADDVLFCSNLLDKNDNTGELFGSSSKDRIYYVTVEIMEHGQTDVLATLTSTMQTGKEADKQ